MLRSQNKVSLPTSPCNESPGFMASLALLLTRENTVPTTRQSTTSLSEMVSAASANSFTLIKAKDKSMSLPLIQGTTMSLLLQSYQMSLRFRSCPDLEQFYGACHTMREMCKRMCGIKKQRWIINFCHAPQSTMMKVAAAYLCKKLSVR